MSNQQSGNNFKYFILGAIVVLGAGVAYMAATGQFNDEPELSIDVSEDGIDIDTN